MYFTQAIDNSRLVQEFGVQYRPYRERVLQIINEVRADIGIALDGDADRVILVDERGHLVDGDQLLAVIAQSWKEDGRLAKPGIVATVMSNLGLERFLEGQGIELVRTPSPKKRTPFIKVPSVTPVAAKMMFSPEARSFEV